MKKIPLLFIFFAISLAICAHGAAAVAVSTPYLENNIIQVYKGGSTLFTITLQNVKETDEVVRLAYTSDMDVVKALDYKELYKLPAGSIDTEVTFNITAPFNSLPGDTYDFRFSVAPVDTDARGTIALLPGISRGIKVQVISPPKKPGFGQTLMDQGIVLGVLILVAVAYFGYIMMHGKKRKKK
ncbi:MAG: hypothetical protein V1702_03025 [Candidatus Woesearchaeota archaeon]